MKKQNDIYGTMPPAREQECLLALFALGRPASTKDIMDFVNKKWHAGSPLTVQTISTHLCRLSQRGITEMMPKSRNVLHQPRITRDAYVSRYVKLLREQWMLDEKAAALVYEGLSENKGGIT